MINTLLDPGSALLTPRKISSKTLSLQNNLIFSALDIDLRVVKQPTWFFLQQSIFRLYPCCPFVFWLQGHKAFVYL